MKKIIYSIALLFFCFQTAVAQTDAKADKIVSDLLAEARGNAIKTNFKLAISEKSNSQTQVSMGTFTIKGNKFVLEMVDMKVYFDGKTQWAYVAKNNEVSITEPSEKELSETNPMAILSGFKAKSIIRFSSKVKSAQNYCIEMTPKVKSQDIAKIEVQIAKSNGNLYSIKLINKNGSASLLSLTNFQKNVKVADAIFVFNSAKYKGVEVNDLR
ncbi:MAG TPA: outer membrane lipoprotein carrier protein LolA [Paludibacter sp.]|nr:outer membrane lipoprotein carrier protein LolA [Paludibacter sp.]